MNTDLNKKLRAKAGSVLSYGWDVLWDKFITLFLIMLVVWVASIPFSVMKSTEPHSFGATVLGAFSILYMLFILAPFKVSADFMFLKAIRGYKLDVKELFDVFNMYLNVVLASLLQFAIIGIGMAFLIIPGIIFACRLTFVPYLVMDKKLDPVKAVEESWRLTKGHGWRIFWLYFVSFWLIISGLIVLIFGAVIAFMWIKAAFAGLYQAVIMEKGEYEEPLMEENKNAESEIENNLNSNSENKPDEATN